jgi:hypothetical protein
MMWACLSEEEYVAYNEKALQGLDMTPGKFHDEYPIVLRITPKRSAAF